MYNKRDLLGIILHFQKAKDDSWMKYVAWFTDYHQGHHHHISKVCNYFLSWPMLNIFHQKNSSTDVNGWPFKELLPHHVSYCETTPLLEHVNILLICINQLFHWWIWNYTLHLKLYFCLTNFKILWNNKMKHWVNGYE